MTVFDEWEFELFESGESPLPKPEDDYMPASEEDEEAGQLEIPNQRETYPGATYEKIAAERVALEWKQPIGSAKATVEGPLFTGPEMQTKLFSTTDAEP